MDSAILALTLGGPWHHRQTNKHLPMAYRRDSLAILTAKVGYPWPP
ncbi:MAG: hypothetical protein AAFN42_06365 [Cyanobacteria bacterium J06554_1]